jgi:putative protease
VYCDFHDAGRHAEAAARLRSAGVQAGIATPCVLMPGEEDVLRRIADASPDVVLVRNYRGVRFFHRHAPQIERVADYSFNVVNDLTATTLAEHGFARIVPGHDLDRMQLAELLAVCPGVTFEVIVHSYVPMFHMRYCLFASRLAAGHDCRDCARTCARHDIRLRDRIGVDHPVFVDAVGRNMVFNGRPRAEKASIAELRRHGVRHFRIELLQETADQMASLLDAYAAAIGR